MVKFVKVMFPVAAPEITPVAASSASPSGRPGEISQLSRYSRQYEEPIVQVAPIALSPDTPSRTVSLAIRLVPSTECRAVSMKNWL